MILITVSEARKNLACWIRRAGEGEEIAITYKNHIIALRLMPDDQVDETKELMENPEFVAQLARIKEGIVRYTDIDSIPD